MVADPVSLPTYRLVADVRRLDRWAAIGYTDAMRLSQSDFLRVVRDAPLVSIDLIVHDRAGAVLVGLRTNPPAKGFWFVPGGCIYKDERKTDAFARIARAELGLELAEREARFLGVFEHLYPDNAGELPGFGTHYVVLGYEVRLSESLTTLPDAQHSAYRWLTPDVLCADNQVHPNTKAYFL